MNWQTGMTAAAVFTTFLVTSILLINTWNNRRAPGALAYFHLMLLNLGWLLGSASSWHAGTEAGSLFFFRLTFLFVSLVPGAFLRFALQFTRNDRYVNFKSVFAVLLPPFFTQIIIWTNPSHHLIWTDVELITLGVIKVIEPSVGPWFWIHTAYSYILILIGAAVLIADTLRQKKHLQRQSILIMIGILFPLAVSTLSFLDFYRGLTLDPTPYLFAFTSPAVVYGFMRFHIFDLIPIQREALIDGMNDGIIVINRLNRIIDLNPAACEILELDPKKTIGMEFQKAVPRLQPWLSHRDIDTWQQAQIEIAKDQAVLYYSISSTPLRHKVDADMGHMVLLRDITRLKKSEIAERSARHMAEDRSEELEILNHFASTLNQASTLVEASAAGLPILIRYLDAEASWLSLSRNLDPPILAAVETSQGTLDPSSFDSISRENCPSMELLADIQKNIFRIDDCPLAQAVSNRSSGDFLHLCIPLRVGNRLLGSLHLLFNSDLKQEIEHSDFYATIAQQYSATIERTHLFEELQQLATTDPLTGLNNRRHFDYLAERELRRAARMIRPLALLMMDLDHFKEVNDLYGHLTGDSILKEIANRCSSTLRELDLFARYGGEEFIILLPDCDFERALNVAERLRSAISGQPFSTSQDLIWVTVSIGVTALPAGKKKPLEALIHEADMSLYSAKSSGRNNVKS